MVIRLARSTDPDTSHQGARDVEYRAGSQKARLLEAYRLSSTPLTDEEAAGMAGLTGIGYWKRCSDLRNEGKIRDTGKRQMGTNGTPVMLCEAI